MTLILDSWSMQSFTQRHFYSEAMDKERENMIWTSDVRQTGYGHFTHAINENLDHILHKWNN